MNPEGKIKRFTGQMLVETLQKEIVENAIRPGMRLPTAREIARSFMVSQKTADRALRSLARKGIVERIPGKGTFVKHNRPKIMRPKIAIFFGDFPDGTPDLKQSAYGYFQNILLKSLDDAGYRPDIFNINIDDFRKSELPEIDFRKYEIIISTIHNAAWRKILLEKSPVPVIFSNDDKPNPGKLHQAYYDYYPGFVSALTEAKKAGFEKFIICERWGHEHKEKEIRTEAVMAAAAELGIKPENIIRWHNDSKIVHSIMLSGHNAVEYIIANKMIDHMIITTSDFIAYGMLEEFAKYNMIAGKDYHLISYDNTEERNTQLKLGLTAITHPLDNMVEAIMQMIEDLTRYPENDNFFRAYQVPANKIIFRETFSPENTIK